MPKLYLKEYARVLNGREIFIACREGILRDHFQNIIADIKHLNRHGAITTLFHNMPNRFANQKMISALAHRLPTTGIVRISPANDFYDGVLNHQAAMFKVIFLERRYLVDHRGNKINAITTNQFRESQGELGDLIANVNYKGVIKRICQKIEEKRCDRVHILPVGKHAIKHELFTVEGSGTLIANNFKEAFRHVKTDEEVVIVQRILALYKRSGFLKSRSKAYLHANRDRFYVTAIDGIVVGCVEQKVIDDRTVELGALAISTRFRNQRVGVHTVTAFMDIMKTRGYTRFISLTNNPRLEALYLKLGFVQKSPPAYRERQAQSPDVKMFYKTEE